LLQFVKGFFAIWEDAMRANLLNTALFTLSIVVWQPCGCTSSGLVGYAQPSTTGAGGEDANTGVTGGTNDHSVTITVTRIDARPSGHPLDSGIEPDPIIDLPFMKAAGVVGVSETKIQITGPSVIRVPDWIPDNEKTHPDAVYYMYYAAHGSKDIRLAWAESITGEWHLSVMKSRPEVDDPCSRPSGMSPAIGQTMLN
jgi:hypothetical protein